MAKNVTVIPASKQRFSAEPINTTRRRRTCGYARVSTELEEQANSYETQMTYYKNYIEGRSDMEFVGMYSDEGITATSTKHRTGFNQMVQDALDGKIDLILTKSVSRFARNTVDSLTTVRKLKEKGVEIYFEKENIWTLDSKGELLITIMSSLAQEESRSISENTTWGQRKRMADGHGCIAFTRFLGYDKGPNGEFVINEEQAVIVRRIYDEFLKGYTLSRICRGLEEDGIKTVTGKTKWFTSNVKSILQNEKYKGDCLMQKYYIEDYLTKKLVKNGGELQQYYVKNHHPGIVSEEVFDAAQMRFNEEGKLLTGKRDFSSMVYCGECGKLYGSKTWHSNDKYRRVIYRCNGKYKDSDCSTPAVGEERLKEMFVEAFNSMFEGKDAIIDNLSSLVSIKERSLKTPEDIRQVAVELDNAEAEYRRIIDEQKTHPGSIDEFDSRVREAGANYERLNEEYSSMLEKNDTIKSEIYALKAFIERLREVDGIIEDYNYELMKQTVNRFTVHKDKRVVVEFIGGIEVETKI